MSKTLSDNNHGRVAPFAVPFAVDTSHLNPYRFGGRKVNAVKEETFGDM